MKKTLQIAGAYIGVIVGAGFASGQEVLQFFTAFGWYGLAGTVIATILFAFLGMHILQLGQHMQTTSHKVVIYKICGKYIGFFVDIILTFFLFGVAVIMIAGSGSIFEQQFGISAVLGNFILTLLVIATLCLNVKKIISVISMITPYLFLLMFIIVGFSLSSSDLSFSQMSAISDSQTAAASNWFVSAALYVSFNIVLAFSMLVVMGSSERELGSISRGGILGGVGLGILLFVINIGLFFNIDRVLTVDMPTLLLASELSPVLGILMSIALLGMIFNTAVGMLYTFTTRFIKPENPSFKKMVVIISILAFASSFVGFTKLVNTLYPFTGYLGFALVIAIIVSWITWKRKGVTRSES
ncbi:YkvI family membrane protein [Oceanobacillus manasiensis]|uniref:YkvI family membrane protein n=1 Tax=Oceanobacillus manasiensis TaxID=586413 RepID=UPI0005A95600|nr:membrane protein [Oceanobacillus manasiensis]